MKGSMRQHGRGWQVRYWYTDSVGRRRQRGETVGTKRDAERLLRRRLDEEEKGQVTARHRGTLGSYLDYWLANYAEPTLQSSTVYRYKGHLRRSVVPYLGDVELQRLTPTQIQHLYTLLASQGLSQQTILHVHTILHKALGSAVRWQILSANPADRVNRPKPGHSARSLWTLEDLAQFTAAIQAHPLRPLFLTAICTGLRRSELVGAKRSSLNLDHAFLSVTSTRQQVPGIGVVEKEPKTRRSMRAVVLGPGLVAVLREELRRRELEGVSSEYVFCNGSGRPLLGNYVTKAFRAACDAAGVPSITLHDTRHMHASLMLVSGEHMKTVSERMGHSSISTTFDLYAHLMPNAGRESAAQVERQVLGG